MSCLPNQAPQVTRTDLWLWMRPDQQPQPPEYDYYPTPVDKLIFKHTGLTPNRFFQYDAASTQWVEVSPYTGDFQVPLIPTGASPLQITDTNNPSNPSGAHNGAEGSLFLVYIKENNPQTDGPLLMTDRGLVVKKDLMAGGFLDSGQGALLLNYGLSGRPLLSSPPCITLMSSAVPYPSGASFPPEPQIGQLFDLTDWVWHGVIPYWPEKYMWNGSDWVRGGYSGKYDTLFLFQSDGHTPANLDVGDLQIRGSSNAMMCSSSRSRSLKTLASTSGAYEYPQLKLNHDQATITLGENADCNLYRYVAYDENEQPFTVLETDNGFVCPNLNTNGLAVNQNAGIVGALTIGQDANVVIYRQTEGTQAEKDMLRVQTPVDGGFAVEQSLWCNALAVNTNAGIIGSLTVGSGTGNIVLYRPTSGSQAYRDMLVIQTPTDGGVAVEQNLWCNNLAVNSVMGVGGLLSSGGGLTVKGEHGYQNQNSGIELGDSTSNGKWAYIDFHFGRQTEEDYNVRLGNWSDCILSFQTRTSTGGILPAYANIYVLGSSSNYWSYVYANYLRYHTNNQQFDAYDDLSLVKIWGESNMPLPEDYDSQKTRPPTGDPFRMLKSVDSNGNVEDEFFDLESVVSFSLSCAKALAKKQDEHDTLLLALQSEVQELRAELAQKNAEGESAND